MPASGEALRQTAATGRAILVALTANRWTVISLELTAANGEITGGPVGKRLGYGDLVRSWRQQEVLDAEADLRPPDARMFVEAEGRFSSLGIASPTSSPHSK